MKEDYFFRNENGERISATLEYFNKGNDIVVVSHSYASHKDGPLIQDVVEALRERGIDSLRFSYSGCRGSEGNFAEKTITESTKDLEAAIRSVRERDYQRVHLFGASGGGTISMAYAVLNPADIHSLALKSPVWDYPAQREHRYGPKFLERWANEGFILYKDRIRVNYTFIEDAEANWNMFRRAQEIQCPTLIVHGTKDEEVPVETGRKGSRLIIGSMYVEVNGADHDLKVEGKNTPTGGIIAGWLKDQMH